MDHFLDFCAFDVLLLGFGTVLLLYLLAIKSRKSSKELIDRIPGPSPWPLIGSLDLLWTTGKPVNEAVLTLFEGLNKIYGAKGIFRFYLSTKPTVHLTRSDTISKVLMSRNLDKPPEYHLLDRWIGGGLLIDDGLNWKSNRSLLTPAFHVNVIEEFLPIFNKHSRTFCEILARKTSTDDLVPLAMNCSLDVILESAMGATESLQENGDNEYVKALARFSKLYIERSANPLVWNEWLYYYLTSSGREARKLINKMHGFTNEVIKTKVKKMLDSDAKLVGKPHDRTGGALIEILLREHLYHATLSTEEVRIQCETFIFAGFDTTALAIAFALFHLGHNRIVQEKLRAEILEVLEDGNADYDITLENLKDLTFLDMVVKETLRLTPPVPIVARQVTEALEVGGFTIPANTSVWMHLHILHKDRGVYAEPGKFNPERFSPESVASLDSMAFLPFSGGSRNCIGQKFATNELKIVVAHVVKKFEIESLVSLEQLQLANDIVLKPKRPMAMRFKLRAQV